MKAVLYRHIATNNTTGKLTYEKVVLDSDADTLAVTGDIVAVYRGTHAVAAAKLGERDYINFEQEAAQA